MKNTHLFLSLTVAFTVAGCASTSQQTHEKSPPKASRVEILMYDTTPRPKTDHLDVFALDRPQKPHKVIALLTCEGAVDQEVVMTTAIHYRARQIGAEGVMNAGTINPHVDTINITQGIAQQAMMRGMGIGGSGRSIFRAYAIVYTDK